MEAAARMTIPSDIITEILCRLPTKSLCRFRCVSKVWLSIIIDPNFIKTHRITLNRSHHIFYNYEYDEVRNRTVLYSHPFHHHDPWMLKPTNLPISCIIESTRDTSSIDFRGSCDGLVLVSLYNRGLVVFNPATRESVQLPQAPDHYPHHLRNHEQKSVRSYSTHGIGYDSVTDDYKVITLTSFQFCTDDIDGYGPRGWGWDTSTTVRVSIYSLRSNTWRELFIDSPCEFLYRDMFDRPCQFRYHPSDSFHAVYFNGFLYWFGAKGDTNHSKVLIAFSLVDECLCEVPPPNFCNDTEFPLNHYCKLIVLGGRLAIIYVTHGDDWSRCGKFEAWLMNEYGVKESWTKIPLDIFNDGDFCMPNSIFDDNGKIRVATDGHMLIFDFEKRILSEKVYIWSRRFWLFGSYVESLVSPKKEYN